MPAPFFSAITSVLSADAAQLTVSSACESFVQVTVVSERVTLSKRLVASSADFSAAAKSAVFAAA